MASRILLVALSLLASAATAHAECAWVLWWAHGTDRSGMQEWRAVFGAPSDTVCWERLATVKMTTTPQGAERTAVDGSTVTAYFHDGSKVVVEFTCLPDTVDPRGPKGK